ncbi:MAG: Do family serine endopeptidase [Bacteroidales bacterium]|nr:Do family serine endopeptidase [Bacteroidales bacterium]
MKSNAKQWLSLIAVSAISSGITLSAFTLVSDAKNENPKSEYSVPVSYASVSASPAVTTDFTVAAESSIHAVVHIKATVSRKSMPQSADPFFDFFFGDRGGMQRQMTPQPQVGFGSGVIISADGYIVTNNHVVDNSDELDVTLNDNRTFKAKLIGTDPVTDIALIKIEEQNLPTIPFGDSEKLKVGEWVLAVGNPFNLTSTVTAGIVSAKARSLGVGAQPGAMKIESFIQTDAAVNPGNSGGALVNTKGELVGINTAIASQTGNYAGYSFAVPVTIVGKVVADLRQFGTVQRAMLGVSIRDINSDFAKEKNLSVFEGAYIDKISDRSAAMEAGLKESDVIIAVNDIKVKSVSELQEQISRYRPGDKVKVKLMRGKDEKEFSLTLKNKNGNTSVVKEAGVEILGAAFKSISDEVKKQLGLSFGVQVTGTTKGKFETAGIRKGFIIIKINEERMSTPEDVEKMTNQILNGNSDEKVLFVVGVYPNGKTNYYAIDLSE